MYIYVLDFSSWVYTCKAYFCQLRLKAEKLKKASKPRIVVLISKTFTLTKASTFRRCSFFFVLRTSAASSLDGVLHRFLKKRERERDEEKHGGKNFFITRGWRDCARSGWYENWFRCIEFFKVGIDV